MKQCIICRKEKNEVDFSDEHVIPDSINGYYHIYTVCSVCNSNLGRSVDSKLLNHKFIEFQREALKIKGKSGQIPNPFEGTHTLSDDSQQKVITSFNDKGELIPKLIPKLQFSKEDNGTSKISLTLDKRDLNQKDKIIKKILKRNGIDINKVKVEEKQIEHSIQPQVKMQMQIDVKDFKIGILKIAYEFTVDSICSYFNDPMATTISNILEIAALSEMEKSIMFFGDGLTPNSAQFR
jgi:hypothetical protein